MLNPRKHWQAIRREYVYMREIVLYLQIQSLKKYCAKKKLKNSELPYLKCFKNVQTYKFFFRCFNARFFVSVCMFLSSFFFAVVVDDVDIYELLLLLLQQHFIWIIFALRNCIREYVNVCSVVVIYICMTGCCIPQNEKWTQIAFANSATLLVSLFAFFLLLG